jgi:hypothetical protein
MLIDIVCSMDFGHLPHLQSCKSLLEDIIKKLLANNNEYESLTLPQSIHSKVSDEGSAQPDDKHVFTDDEVEVNHPNFEGFRSVIGCELAKSSLLENVVLPMTLASSTFAHVFQGMLKMCTFICFDYLST